MAEPVYATVANVQTRLGRTIPTEEQPQVKEWILDTEDLILSRLTGLPALVSAGTVTERTVTRVVCQAVIRKIKNPDGLANERTDDYSYGLNDDAAKGEIHLTDDEWADLTPTSSAAAFTIRPQGVDWDADA